jgi:hypothetical protein
VSSFSLATNVLPLHAVVNLGTDYFLLKIKILAKLIREFTTKFAILPNAVMGWLSILLSVRHSHTRS